MAETKFLNVPTETIDMQTGAIVKTEMARFMIMPPAASACQVCGRNPAHEPMAPHDNDQMYWQYAFFADHDRWPTWKDAVAHCAPEVRAAWEHNLRKLHRWTEPKE